MVACISILGCASPHAKDVQEPAIQAIYDVSDAYLRLLGAALPAGAAPPLASLRRSIRQLEGFVGRSPPAPEPGSWRAPTLAEQADWERAFPSGGALLRCHACPLSAGGAALAPGRAFVSDVGVALGAGAGFGALAPWRGLAASREGAELALRPVEGAALRLRLALPEEAAWIEELWSLQRGAEPCGELEVPLWSNASLSAEPEEVDASPTEHAGAQPVLLGHASPSSKLHRCLSWKSEFAELYNEGPGGRAASHAPEGCPPSGSEKLEGIELSQIVASLRSDSYLPAFFRCTKKAEDISMTPWCASRQSPEVLVRKGTFLLPLPQDFPKAVTRLVNLPSETRVTVVHRLRERDDSVVFTVQFCSHDVPFGDNFRVHETVKFQPDGAGGVLATKWVEVMWVAALPWAYGVLRTIIEQKSRADALGNYLVADLRSMPR